MWNWRNALLTAILLAILLLGIAPVITVAQGVYRAPITIVERSGTDLYDYTVKIELNETNFDGWGNVADNLSDIYFLDANGQPLYYWIEYANKTERNAVIWVKVPYIPASSSVTIYMYYGGTNPYSSYNDLTQVFDGYYDFNMGGTPTCYEPASWQYECDFPEGFVYYCYRTSGGIYGAEYSADAYEGAYSIHGWVGDTSGNNYYLEFAADIRFPVPGSGYVVRFYMKTQASLAYTAYNYVKIQRYNSDTSAWEDYATVPITSQWSEYEVPLPSPYTQLRVLFRAYTGSDATASRQDVWIDYVIVRKYTEPEPTVRIGPSTLATVVELPLQSLILYHSIVYSPSSTQFTHSFTAANTTTADYETNYTDAWGWRVWAEPYEVNGTYYENNVSLVSEVNITLPYTDVLVENLTFYARTNGTGSYRQLWVRVLDSTGGVVAELTNATIGTDWTEVVLNIKASLSGQVTIWINATVVSTASAGEEIAVKDVRLYVEYNVNPKVTVPWIPNIGFFNCSASHFVELGSTEYLNSSAITFKLIEYLALNATDYPVQPTYIGNETIDSRVYRVYRVEPANYSQYLTIYALLENKLKTFRIHVKGFDTDTVIIGEPVTIELPELGNITIVGLNQTFINVTSVTLRFTSVGTFVVEANLTQPALWKLGYSGKAVTVKYGSLTVKPLDLDSRVVDYESMVLQLVNKTSGSMVRELTGNQLFTLNNLWAGNYSLVLKFKDIVVGVRDFWLNITTDGSTVDLLCTMKSLTTDYRGFNRTIVYEYRKQLLGVESLSDRFPYSRMRILLNGTGSFKLYINYRGDLPTKVSVTGNVTGLKYYWDGDYLVITGTLGSVGEINVTDLYRLRVELYDRLGNLMPSWIYVYVNETRYSGAVVEDYYYPDDYVVKLPTSINGFEFYGFFDGFNETVRAVTINGSDVTLRAWYRVPTVVGEVRSFQVASQWWIPFMFIKQDSDRVKVYIEGYLRDYYGNGVPGRPVVVNIVDVEAGFTWSINTTTDATGYWRTPLLELVRGRVYRVEVVYAGDDVYVGSASTLEVKPEELPVAPAFEIPVEYLIAAVAVILVVVGIAATLRASRHVIEDLQKRRFVKRKG